MFRLNFLFATLACAILVATSNGFAPQQQAAYRPAASIQGASPKQMMNNSNKKTNVVVLHMSEPEKPQVSADGTFYDDEIDSAPKKEGISNSMKERLIREASTGLDSNKSQSNVLLYICAAVTLLVIAGGQGILY